MTPPPLPEAHFIDTPQGLHDLIERLCGEPLLAVDTESNSLYVYHERVCLIQISTRAADFVIDPLALDDLSALGALMADPGVEKVFHAAEYDIMCLKRDFVWTFANLFDTMTAARVLGWPQVGLSSLLAEAFGVTMDKRYQRANWGARPLPREQLRYAQMDTHYLLPLRDRLADALRWGGHDEEAREMFAEAAALPAAEHRFDPEGFWRVNGARDLPLEKMALVRELYLFRERAARQRDCPPFKVFSDSTLVRLAAQAPRTLDDLRLACRLSDREVRQYGKGILSALRRGESGRPPRPPAQDMPAPDVLDRYEALRAWRRDRAQARGVESDVIVSRDALWALARQAPRTLDALQHIDGLGPWRRKTYGPEILEVIRSVPDGRDAPHRKRN